MTPAHSAQGPEPRPIVWRVWLPILAACFTGLSALYFLPWTPQVLFGDDLANYIAFLRGELASTPWQALTQSFAEKYRPVFAVALGALFSVFGTNVDAYMYANLLLNGTSAALLAVIAFKLSGGRRLIALLAALVLVNSRYALYQVTQITGALEGIGYLLLLAMVLGVVQLSERRIGAPRGTTAWVATALVAEWLLIFTHERYLTVAPWLAAMLVISSGVRRLPVSRRLGLAGLSLAPALLNYTYKTAVLKDAVLVGTGGSHIDFNPATVTVQLQQAVYSLGGFNHGPDYLAGRSTLDHLDTMDGALAIAYLGLLVLIAVLGTASDLRTSTDWRDRLLAPAALMSLAVFILAPPAMTIRMEQRWLLEPQALVVLTLAWCVGKLALRHGRAALMLFAAFAVTSLAIDWRLRTYFPNIFFVQSGKAAEVVKRDIIDATPGPHHVTVLAGQDVCGWVLQQHAFFKLYGERGDAAACLPHIDNFTPSSADLTAHRKVYLLSGDDHARDVSAAAYQVVGERSEVMKRDFIGLYDTGRIDNAAKVDTPSGTGAFILPIESALGPVETLTVISGFAYIYDHVRLSPGDRLKFNAAMVYPTKEPARAVVKVLQAGKPASTIYNAILPLTPKDGLPASVSASIPVGDNVGEVSIAFSVETPGSDTTAHWVAFSQPRIVSAARQSDRTR